MEERGFFKRLHAPIAQLDRASDSDFEGCRFESCWVYQLKPLNFKRFRGFLGPKVTPFYYTKHHENVPFIKVILVKDSSGILQTFVLAVHRHSEHKSTNKWSDAPMRYPCIVSVSSIPIEISTIIETNSVDTQKLVNKNIEITTVTGNN